MPAIRHAVIHNQQLAGFDLNEIRVMCALPIQDQTNLRPVCRAAGHAQHDDHGTRSSRRARQQHLAHPSLPQRHSLVGQRCGFRPSLADIGTPGLPNEAASAGAENRVRPLVGKGYVAKLFRLRSIAFLGLRLDELIPGHWITVGNSPSIQQRFAGHIGFRLGEAVEIVGKSTSLLAGNPTLRGHSWSMIRQQTGIAKGTAQRVFYGLPTSPASSTH